MRRDSGFSKIFFCLSLIYLFAFCLFYYKYVPLVKSFQLILAPLLLIIFILTLIDVKWGILFFVFMFPLINSLPYFFGIGQATPHAPTALVLFLAFFLGWLLRNCFSYQKIEAAHSISRPLLLFALIILVSGIITFFRYTNFFPFQTDQVPELVVNVNGVRAGGALMSCVFSLLNYITGFLFFAIIYSMVKSREFQRKILIALSVATLIVLIFAVIQKYVSISLGNTQFFVNLNRLNSTFKDPNSFGLFVSAFFPVLLGMFFAFKKYFKIYVLFLIILSLFVFPSIGSRSGMLGIILASLVFFTLSFLITDISLKKKILFFASFILIVIMIFAVFFILFEKTDLYQRTERDLNLLFKESSINLTGRVRLWRVALAMIRDFPLDGVGLGSYIINLPNYSKLIDYNLRHTDSAENYFIHVGAELGLIGLFVALWLFYEIIMLLKNSWNNLKENNRDKFILIGLISALASVFVNLLLHSYIGAFDVKYFFWLLVGLICVFIHGEKLKPEKEKKFGIKFKYAALILVLIFGAVHLWNSTHALSIRQSADRFGWDQNFGLYPVEKDDRGFSFNWTKKNAGLSVPNLRQELIIPLKAAHPGIDRHPVEVKIYLADKNFKKRELIKEFQLNHSRWINFEYSLLKFSGERVYLIFETDRAWQPLKSLGIPDPRWLAIELGEPWFKIPPEDSYGETKVVETIPAEGWEGKFKRNLYSNGISRMKFRVNREALAFRLRIRGQKAFGIGPLVIIRLDNQIIAKTKLEQEGWVGLIFSQTLKVGEHELSIEFINDFYKPKLKQDRNVILGDLEIIYMQ